MTYSKRSESQDIWPRIFCEIWFLKALEALLAGWSLSDTVRYAALLGPWDHTQFNEAAKLFQMIQMSDPNMTF